MPSPAVVVIGGDPPHIGVVSRLPVERVVYAADSGLDHADAMGLEVHHLIGDLDSVSDAALRRHPHVTVDRHPTDKDATDTELALAAAARAGHRDVIVVSGGGDRLDHLLGSLTVLARFARTIRLEAWIGTAHVHVLHDGDRVVLAPPPGSILSLVPLAGAAEGVTACGVRWPLDRGTLDWGTSRGISNEVTGDVTVSLVRGVLAVIVPHALDATTPSAAIPSAATSTPEPGATS